MRGLKSLISLSFAIVLVHYLSVFGQVDTPPANDTTAVTTAIPTIPVPAPPANVIVKDTPYDNGTSLEIRWDLSPDDVSAVTKYQVMRANSADSDFTVIGETTQGQNSFTNGDLVDGQSYFYKVVAVFAPDKADGALSSAAASVVVGPVAPSAQWFNLNRIWIFLWTLIICGAILIYIQIAKSGKELYVRRIAGIEAVEEAIGRATEMGRKVMFIPGIQDMDDVQTIAAITILGRVAKIAAENDTMLDVPVCKSLVMVTGREAVREAYQKAGRPDAFREDQVHYVTDDQFGYAAAIDGMVVRDKPATMFYMGAFFAESLILAETGNAAGAIQIAGTGQPSQLPFFVASCDYTLIGEELFAASAYLAREPKLLGSLKGQDFAKAAFLIYIILAMIVAVGFGWHEILKIVQVQ